MSFPTQKHKVIYADPAWNFKNWSSKGEGRNANQHYRCMPLKDIKALPVQFCADKDCVLFMWVTFPFLEKAFEVIEAWGFTYKTVAFNWMKQNRKSDGLFMGGGYWTRSNGEVCLLATRGKPKRKAKDVRQAILSHRREHSRKPDEIYERIERLVDGPYLELFARQQRPGWTSWGNETNKFKGAS
tara:strand:- start:7 stop:561 length:555 start_codon:yes stop_codon:yes gene_type:complete